MFRLTRTVAPSRPVFSTPQRRASSGAPVFLRRWIIGALLVIAVAGASSCGSDGESAATTTSSTAVSSPSSTTTTSSSTTTTATQPTSPWTAEQQAVLDDFMAARAAFSTSLESPDPDNPELAATHVDPMLTEVTNTNAEWKGFGQAGRFPENSVSRTDALSIEITGDQAIVETCGVDDSVVFDTATGAVLNDDVVTVRASSTLTNVDGDWKLTTRSELERWEGVAGCAVEQS